MYYPTKVELIHKGMILYSTCNNIIHKCTREQRKLPPPIHDEVRCVPPSSGFCLALALWKVGLPSIEIVVGGAASLISWI